MPSIDARPAVWMVAHVRWSRPVLPNANANANAITHDNVTPNALPKRAPAEALSRRPEAHACTTGTTTSSTVTLSLCLRSRAIRTFSPAAIHARPNHDTMALTNDTPGHSLHSLDLLEARLHRISYALNGDQEIEDAATAPGSAQGTAASRLRKLELQMQTLASKSSTVDQLLKLQAQHPQIFTQANSAEHPNALSLPSQAALVLSHAKLYSKIAGQLRSLQETSVPDPTSASKLRELQPRIDRAAARQEQQAAELAELRSRSAAAVERWYETGVLGMAEQWAEWEERMRDVEIVVRRLEAVKKREEELV